jgi:hypothetical protein
MISIVTGRPPRPVVSLEPLKGLRTLAILVLLRLWPSSFE